MKITKLHGGGLGLVLPPELVKELGILDGQEVDIIPVKKDVLVLVLKEPQKQKEKKGLSNEELELLKKLNTIRFSERTGNKISKKLTKEEMKLLQELVKKGVIIHMSHGKYKDQGGVYSITREYFQMLKSMPKKEESPIKALVNQLYSSGYLVLTDVKIAEELATELNPDIESGKVTAIKTFDGKIFFVTSGLVDTLGNEVLKLLGKSKRGMSIQTLADKLKSNPDQMRAVIEILREAGDIIEKRKGIYTVA